jgi:predicted membrane protein
MEDQATFRITPRLIFGVFVLMFGSLLLLDQMHVLDARDYLIYWPAGLILLGLMKLLQPGSKGGAIVLTVIGTGLLLSNLDYLVFDFDLLFPALMVLGGISLISGEILRRARRKTGEAVSASAEIDPFAILGSVKRISSSQSFRGGSATALLGAAEIDLRQARIQGGEAVIDTFAFWGGIEIFVPEDWEVVQRGIPILGAFEDLTRPPLGNASQRLVIKGMAIMGGIEVRNWRKEEQDVRRMLREEPARRDEIVTPIER